MPRILGLDIGQTTLRGVLLKTAIRKVELIGYYETPIAPPAAPVGAEQPSELETRSAALSDAVRAMLRAVGQPPDRVVTSFPGEEVSLRTLTLPKAFTKRIAEVLPSELESVLPFDPNTAVIDYQPVRETAAGVELLVAAVPRERIAAYLGDMAKASLDPRELGVGAAALDGLIELVPSIATGGPHLILDVAAARSDLCMIKDGKCVLARTLSSGMEHAQSGLLAIGIHQTIASYRAAGGDPPVQALICGEAGVAPTAPAWFSERLGVPAQPVTLIPSPVQDPATLPLFARAAALAARASSRARRLDLRQGEFAAKRTTLGAMVEHARLAAACAAVIALAFAYSTYARWSVLDDQRQALESRLAEETKRAFGTEVRSATRARELIANAGRSQDPLPRFDAYKVLEALSTLIPPDITHDTRRLNIELDDDGQRGTFDLQGTVNTVTETDRLADILASHECFKDIEKGQVSSTGAGEETRRNYQIEVAVRCPGVPEQSTTRRRGGSRGQQ